MEKPELVSEEEKRLFRSALDIDWKAHIDVQAAFQKHCHGGISKTINMPHYAGKGPFSAASFLDSRIAAQVICSVIFSASSRASWES